MLPSPSSIHGFGYLCGDRRHALQFDIFEKPTTTRSPALIWDKDSEPCSGKPGFSIEQVTDTQRLQLVSEAELTEFDDILSTSVSGEPRRIFSHRRPHHRGCRACETLANE